MIFSKRQHTSFIEGNMDFAHKHLEASTAARQTASLAAAATTARVECAAFRGKHA
jgi:hypothetical protein